MTASLDSLGRRAWRRGAPGEANGRARLTAAQVAAIRSSRASQRSLARRYGVGKSTIWNIKAGRSWR